MTEPYGAALNKDWNALKNFYELHKEFVTASLTVTGDTALHIAVHSGNTQLVRSLLNQILGDDKGNESPLFHSFIEELAPLRRKNEYGDTALHEAASRGHLEIVKLLLDRDEELLKVKNNRGETPLFRAAAFGQTKVVRFLASRVDDMRTHRRRDDSTSILHIAVLGRYFETAVELLRHDISPDSIDENGMTCFQLLANMPSAFRSGYSMGKLASLLYYYYDEDDDIVPQHASSGKKDLESGQGSSQGNIPTGLPQKDDQKLDDIVPQPASSKEEDLESGHGRKPLQGYSQVNQPTGTLKAYCNFWRGAALVLPAIGKLWDIKKKQSKVLELLNILAKQDLSWIGGNFGGAPDEKIHLPVHEKDDAEEADKDDEEDAGSSRSHAASETSFRFETPLIAAARNGIMEIVEAILKVYPQAIEHVNQRNENIFHVAARYRRAEILELLQSSHIPISRLRRKINADGDSILHKAAYLGEYSLRDRPGEALRMQSEIQWFKRVQKIVPSYFINHRNKDEHTAQFLFSKQHRDLVRRGQEWLMRTTQACTLVAVLIATVAFTCAYTVPGGSSKTGHPLLLRTTPFIVFTTADTLSLCFSLTSVVVFLSIMTSKMQEQDFRRSLPLKLVLGLTTLFFAVAAMMVAFAATLVLMMRKRLHWAAIPIYTIACCPVTIFLVLQLPLYLNIAWFTVQDLVQSLISSFPHGKCLNPRSCAKES
ncbi:ankyrin repeat-containing protein ITN1 [Morus notabilis]|uniref:ankyrin repeat-containing protein ITN1 n=2 Tax=Morus notabilis TaxID=981085 RepID=UPI000CED2587|nr:ankyrin repeat-containing protein ITN1 [Morus notabilis]